MRTMQKHGWAGRREINSRPVLVCAVCAGAMPRDHAFTTSTCNIECGNALNEARQKVMRAVFARVKAGDLPSAKGCVCVDCGGKAFDYDHRHYLKPFDVEPVCRSCNQRRGNAADIQEFIKSHFSITGSVNAFIEIRWRKRQMQHAAMLADVIAKRGTTPSARHEAA